jgi:transposase InsO family protein
MCEPCCKRQCCLRCAPIRLRGQRFLTIINPVFLLTRLSLERITVWLSREHHWFMKFLERRASCAWPSSSMPAATRWLASRWSHTCGPNSWWMLCIWRSPGASPRSGLVHHSDSGGQYTSLPFGKRLEVEGLVPSMGRVGSAYDNALAESFVVTLKTKLLYRSNWPTQQLVRTATFEYIEGFHNTRRSRSTLGHLCSLSSRTLG